MCTFSHAWLYSATRQLGMKCQANISTHTHTRTGYHPKCILKILKKEDSAHFFCCSTRQTWATVIIFILVVFIVTRQACNEKCVSLIVFLFFLIDRLGTKSLFFCFWKNNDKNKLEHLSDNLVLGCFYWGNLYFWDVFVVARWAWNNIKKGFPVFFVVQTNWEIT